MQQHHGMHGQKLVTVMQIVTDSIPHGQHLLQRTTLRLGLAALHGRLCHQPPMEPASWH